MTPPRSVRTWSAGSRAAGSSSGTTRTVSTPRTWTASTCRASRRSASPTTSSRIKNRLLHDEPTSKFLVYRSGQVPTGIGNWLLDLELAYGVFTADRTALVAQDLGLTGKGIDEVVQAHEKFFNATKRVQSLKALLNPEDDAAKLRAKISAVVLGQREHSLLEITRTLLTENAKGLHAKYDALVDYGLDDFYWRGVASIYGYESASPSIDDLVLWIFRKAIEGFKSDRPGGLQNIQLDFASLRNDRRSQEAMATLAKRAARDLDYASKIEDASFRDLVAVDLFEETDQKIISDLARAVAEQTVTAARGRRGRAGAAEQRVDRRLPAALHGYRQRLRTAGRARLAGSRDAVVRRRAGALPPRVVPHRPALPAVRLRRAHGRVPEAAGGAARAGREALHQQVRLRAGQRVAAAGGPGRQVALDRAALADVLLRRLRRAAGAGWRQEGRRHHLRRAALRGGRRTRLAHPAGGPLRRHARRRPRGAAELHATRHGGASAALDAQALRRCQDRARRRPADEQHRFPRQDPRERRWHGDPGRGLQGPERRRAARALQGQPGPVRLPQPDRRHRRQARHRTPGLRGRRGHAARHRRPREEAGQRQRHQHLHHGRPRLPVPGRGSGRHVLPVDPAAGRRHQGRQPALRAGARASRSTTPSQPSTPPSSGSRATWKSQIPKSIHRLRLAGGGLTVRPRRGDAAGDRRPGAGGQQEAQERHPTGQRRGLAGVRQDHHRAGRRPPVPVRAGQRQGPAPHAPGRALRRRDADLEPRRPDLRPDLDRQARPLPERTDAAQPGRRTTTTTVPSSSASRSASPTPTSGGSSPRRSTR